MREETQAQPPSQAPLKALITTLALLGALAIGPASASATLPPYVGDMSFPTIHGPSDPEEYSWEAILYPGQQLKSIDSQEAEVVYEDGTVAFFIRAESAHDAVGTTVPTSLDVSAGNVVTLTVHHRAGNPATGGVPFTYPVSVGMGWETGYSTVIVTGPPDESELREERERIARGEREAQARAAKAAESCIVPKLKGGSLKATKRRLREADCKVGMVRKRGNATASSGWVVQQSSRPGTVLASGTSVDVTLSTPAN